MLQQRFGAGGVGRGNIWEQVQKAVTVSLPALYQRIEDQQTELEALERAFGVEKAQSQAEQAALEQECEREFATFKSSIRVASLTLRGCSLPMSILIVFCFIVGWR